MWLRNSRLQIVFQISSPKVVWQNLLGNYIKFLVKNPKITRKIAVFTRAAIRSPKIEKILFSRIQPSETLDYKSFSKFRLRKWRVRNWLGTPLPNSSRILLQYVVDMLSDNFLFSLFFPLSFLLFSFLSFLLFSLFFFCIIAPPAPKICRCERCSSCIFKIIICNRTSCRTWGSGIINETNETKGGVGSIWSS